jgi:hypothetical protein
MPRKDPDKYIGRWRETPFQPIDLPFTVVSLDQLLLAGVAADSAYTHQQIADWAGRFFFAVTEGHLGEEPDAELLHASDVAIDIDAQWDLYLVNTFSLRELQSMDFSSVRLPDDWLQDWLAKLRERAV